MDQMYSTIQRHELWIGNMSSHDAKQYLLKNKTLCILTFSEGEKKYYLTFRHNNNIEQYDFSSEKDRLIHKNGGSYSFNNINELVQRVLIKKEH